MSKTEVANIFCVICTIISIGHTIKPLPNKVDIVAVSFHFLM